MKPTRKVKSLRLTHKFSNGCTATANLTRKRKHSGSGQILYDHKPPGHDEKEAWKDFFGALQGALGGENGHERKLDFSIYGGSEEERNRGQFSARVYWRKHEPHPMASDGYGINLVMPVIIWPPSALENPLAVNIDSPKSHRIAVRKLAQFFRREFHYDFVQYDENDGDSDCVAYLWGAPDCILENWRIHCVGTQRDSSIARGHVNAGRPCLASSTLAEHAADPRHILRPASPRKSQRGNTAPFS